MAPIALQVQMVFQPADELHRALGEPLDGMFDDLDFYEVRLWFADSAVGPGFGPAFEFRFIDHPTVLADFLFHQGHEVVGQAEQPGLLGFGGRTAGSGFGFTKFVFEFVEDFFDVPAGFVEQGNEAGRDAGGKIG